MGVRGVGPHARIAGSGPVFSATGERCFLARFRSGLPGLRSCPVALPKRSGRGFGGVFCCIRRVLLASGGKLREPFIFDRCI